MHTKFERLLSKSLTTLEVMTYYLVVHTAPDAYHVQHVMRHQAGKDSSTVKFDRTIIIFSLASFHWLKPFTHEEGEETGGPEEHARQRASENVLY